MKFLPENKKKTIWSLILISLSLGGIIYLNFFARKKPPKVALPPNYNVLPSSDGTLAGVQPDAGKLPGASGVAISPQNLLPYGKILNTAILEQEKFKNLKAAPKLSVSEEELGKDNLFE